MEDQVATPKPKGNFLKSFFMFLLPLLIGAGAAIYGAMLYPQVLGLSKGQAQVQAEVDSLIAEVGSLIALPTDEKPTVATVSDVEKLKDQPFFKNAANGDKVLIYTNAKKAILYRPSEKKVVEVGAVNIRQTEQPVAPVAGTALPVSSPVASPQAE